MAHALRSPRLLPGEREALANELLLQQHQFRQNMALLHGLPQPEGPLRVERRDIPSENNTDDQNKPQAPARPPLCTPQVDADDQKQQPPATPPKKDKLSSLKKAALISALVAAGATVPFLGTLGSKLLANKPAPTQPTEPDTTMSDNLLVELERRGYAVSPTDLGEDIRRAFELNPALREQLLQDVQRTLEEHGVRPTTE